MYMGNDQATDTLRWKVDFQRDVRALALKQAAVDKKPGTAWKP